MAIQQAGTHTVDEAEAQTRLGTLLDSVAGEGARVVVRRGGEPVAAIISAADLERYRQLEREQRGRAFAILDEIGERFRDVPPEEIEREVDKAVAEVREEMRRERDQQRTS